MDVIIQMPNKVYGIITCYYEKYKENAVNEFCEILRHVSKDYTLIIVNNTSLASFETKNKKIIEINSSNDLWEFSAWDDSIQYLRENFPLNKNDTLIFANDTFCHHRWFGKYKKLMFILSFLGLKYFPFKNRIIGERCSFPSSYKVFNQKTSHWISTYLFGVIYKDIEKLFPFSTVNLYNQDDFFILEKNKIQVNNSSPEFELHLNNWLFPKEGNDGSWYLSNNQDQELLKMKLIAILNEKLLSVHAKKNNIQLTHYDFLNK